MTSTVGRSRIVVALLLVAALVFGLAVACERERPKNPPPYNPSSGDHVWRRAAGDAAPQMVFVGDSIMAGWLLAAQYRIDAQVRFRLPNATVQNDAQGGMQVINTDGSGDPDLVGTIGTVLAGMTPGDILVINDGMDDLWSYDGDAAWTGAMVSIVTRSLAAGMRVLVSGITPIGSVNWQRELLRQRLNGWLAAVFSDRYVDFPALLHDGRTGATWMDPRFAWYDGVHPNEGGTAVMANAVVQRVITEGWVTP